MTISIRFYARANCHVFVTLSRWQAVVVIKPIGGEVASNRQTDCGWIR
ncbi:MAG: hypothetical protein ACH255_18205 [Candidatus Thiodiazotropha sp.]